MLTSEEQNQIVAATVSSIAQGWEAVRGDADAAIALLRSSLASALQELARTPTHHHVKSGKLYRFLTYGTHSESCEPVAVYRNVYNGTTWVRPARMFDQPERFRLIPKLPCGECHLKSGEVCDICGARSSA